MGAPPAAARPMGARYSNAPHLYQRNVGSPQAQVGVRCWSHLGEVSGGRPPWPCLWPPARLPRTQPPGQPDSLPGPPRCPPAGAGARAQ